MEDALADVFVAGRGASRRRQASSTSSSRPRSTPGRGGSDRDRREIASYLRGEELPEPAPLLEAIPSTRSTRELSKFRYCTSFFVEGDQVDPDELEVELRSSDSLLVVGATGAVKVHVHTDEPGQALALATAVGVIEEVDVKNMHVQTTQREGGCFL